MCAASVPLADRPCPPQADLGEPAHSAKHSAAGEVERRSGGGSPSSESVQRRPYSICAECSHCVGRRLKTKESRAVFPWRGDPSWWISAFKRGRLGKGVSRGGKPRRGIQQYRHSLTRSYNTDGVIPVGANGVAGVTVALPLRNRHDRRVVRGCDG